MDSRLTVGGTIRLESLFYALGDEHRLRVLANLYFADPGEEYHAMDLVAPEEDAEAVVQSFHHAHFPKLADLGLVEWDRAANAVRRGPSFRVVDQLFDCLATHDEDLLVELLGHEVSDPG